MIITCNKCSTSFNLDDSLVKEGGSKVRCSRCKEIFTAHPLPLEPETLSGLDPESEIVEEDDFGELSDPGTEDNDFSPDDSDLDFEDDDDFLSSGSELSMENADLEVDDTDLESDVSNFDDDDDFFSDDDDLSIDGPEIETGDNDLELESSDLDDGFLSSGSELSMEDADLEIDDNDLELESPELEDDDDFSFEENDFEIVDNAEDGIETIDDDDEVFDGIEFEPIEDDELDDIDLKNSVPVLADDTDSDLTEKADSLGSDSFGEDDAEFELEFDIDDDEIETSMAEDKIKGAAVEIESDPDSEDFSLTLEEDELPAVTPVDDFSEYDEVLQQDTEPEEEALPEEEESEVEETEEKTLLEKPEPVMKVPPVPRRKKQKSSFGSFILILLLLALLVIGAYIASLMTGYKIPYLSDIKIPIIEQYLNKSTPEISEARPVPNQESVNGRFVTNATAGTLFVITGRVENPSNITYSHIEVRGALITKGKVEEKTKNTFCGNIITEEMLKTGNISDINKLAREKAGNHNSNVNIKPGMSVPFMIVFSDLPDKLQNFTVKVIGYKKATDTK